MAGISVQQCINLILNHIGWQKVIPTFKITSDGTSPVKQIGLGSFAGIGSMGMSSINSVLNGASIDSIASNYMQNPIAGVASQLTSAIPGAAGSLQSMAGTFDSVTGTWSGGKFSLEQVNAMTQKLNGSTLTSTLDPVTGLYSASTQLGTGGLSNGLTSLLDHTDKMSGLKIPDYEKVGEFGFSQMMTTKMSIDNFTSEIPKGMDTYNLTGQLSAKVTAITAPLETGPALLSAKSTVADISSLNSLSGTALTNKYNSIMTGLTAANNSTSGVVSASQNAMTAVVNASQAAALPSQISSLSTSDLKQSTSTLLNKVVKPSAMATIKADQAKYGYDAQSLL